MNDIFLIGSGWGYNAAKQGLSGHFIIHELPNHDYLNGKKGAIVVFAGYKPHVPHNFVRDNTCINIHYSLLPKYRGLHSTVWAILNDEDYLGLSIHIMNDYMDDGPIIWQYKVENDRKSTSTYYMELFNSYVAKNLGIILVDYFSGKIELLQNNKEKATWVSRRHLEDCKIDFDNSLNYLSNFFRALVYPYPLPFIVCDGCKYNVTKHAFHKVNVNTHKGIILNIDEEGIWTKVDDGYLIIRELRDEIGNSVPLQRFHIGQKLY